jgi:protein-disulfide isomerase
LAEAAALGVTTTPTFFVNGRRLVGPQGYASLGAVIASLVVSIPQNQRVHAEIASSGPAQAINLDHAPAKGPAKAPVSLVEFSDFQCPFCAKVTPIIRQLLAAYPTQVRFAFKHYPLHMHKESPLAHEAALAAGDQGKFWEMYDLLFAGQDKLTREDLIAKAQQLKLDMPRFVKDLDSRRFKPVVEADRQEGNRLGVDGTPFFFINGHAISGASDLAAYKELIDAVLKEAATPKSK